MIARGTTPTFCLSFNDPDLDLTQAVNVYVTFQSAGQTLTKTGEDLQIEAKQILIFLSQAETLAMGDKGKVQANWTAAGGVRYASDVQTYNLSEQLLSEVVE